MVLPKIKYLLDFVPRFVSLIFSFVSIKDHQGSRLRVAYYEKPPSRRFLQRMLGSALLKSASF